MPRCPRCFRRLSADAICIEDGQQAPPRATPPPALPTPELAGYALGPRLGIGGFSSVYAATQLADGAPVAIKVAHDAFGRARFEIEAEALSLVGPPFAPQLFASCTLDDGRPVLVMEHIAGQTLAERLADAGSALALDDVLQLAGHVLDAVEATHARGLVHRDLKPENVLLARDGVARLVDFGLAARVDRRNQSQITRTGTIVGTAEYMAPEQLRGEPATTAADVYSFGVMLFELMTSRPPFVGDRASVEHGHLTLRPPSPSALRRVPVALEQAVLACLSKTPEQRPDVASMRELLRAASVAPTSTPGATPHTPLATDGLRPVVLVWISGELNVREIHALARRHAAVICHGQRTDCVLGLVGSEDDNPLQAAVVLAREVASQGGRALVHLGRALVRRARGEVRLYGRDVERPDAWLPTGAWRGALLSPRAAAALGLCKDDDANRFLPVSAVDATVSVDRPTLLVGRDSATQRVCSLAARAFATKTPHVCSIVGAAGSGKSALAAHVATTIERAHPEVDVLRLSCRRTLDSDRERVHAVLFGRLPLAREGAPAGRDVVRDAVRALRQRANRRPLLIIADDAHYADELTLEVLRRACDEPDVPLCVVLTAAPSFVESRAIAHAHLVELAPLGEAEAADLATRLLPPRTAVSRDVLHRLARWSAGNPAVLVDLIQLLLRERIVRCHEGTSAWFLAADELDRMPSSPAAQWLAARELDSLPPELADCARICAVLGPDVHADEVDAVERALERAGFDRPLVDAAVGLAQLARAGLLEENDGGFVFRRPATHEAIYALVPAPFRLAVHQAAYHFWRARCGTAGFDRLIRVAHHGAGGGYTRDAQVHYAALAARAKTRHAYREAERMLTAALELCQPSDRAVRLDLHAERGSVRRFLTRYEEAREDFATARALAEETQDRQRLVSVLVDEAAVCDFVGDWVAQARLMEQAEGLAGEGLLPQIEARYRNWLGVARARQGKLVEAVELLESAVALAAALEQHETRVGSLLLLGYLRLGEKPDDGKRLLDEAIALSEEQGDDYHLVIGLLNRIYYWQTVGPATRAEADCRRAVKLACELGFHQLEIYGLHALSITRWCNGDFAGALEAASTAHHRSVERFGSSSSYRERLQYAMLLAAHGRIDEARDALAHVREQDIEEKSIDSVAYRAIHLAMQDSSEQRWQEVVERTRELGEQRDVVEVLWLRARTAARAGHKATAAAALDAARAEAARCRAPLVEMLVAERQRLTAAI